MRDSDLYPMTKIRMDRESKVESWGFLQTPKFRCICGGTVISAFVSVLEVSSERVCVGFLRSVVRWVSIDDAILYIPSSAAIPLSRRHGICFSYSTLSIMAERSTTTFSSASVFLAILFLLAIQPRAVHALVYEVDVVEQSDWGLCPAGSCTGHLAGAQTTHIAGTHSFSGPCHCFVSLYRRLHRKDSESKDD